MRGTLLLASIISLAIGMSHASNQPKRRAPSGFTGVRGKKSIPESVYGDAPSSNDLFETSEDVFDKRAPSGFVGMRGKKPFPDPEDEMIKRAPSGFLGMRGKKDTEQENSDYKRAPSGFMGMRGKKEYEDTYMDKRAPSGFMGMRGKKAFEMVAEEMKRAQMSGFFGMRGKKQPARSSFFGMRGKKYPYEFRGKFVGVRGKKSSNPVEDYGYPDGHFEDFEQQPSRLADDLDRLMILLAENGDHPTLGSEDFQGHA